MRKGIQIAMLAAAASWSGCGAPRADANANNAIQPGSPAVNASAPIASPTPSSASHLLFVVDSSGSMKAKTGSRTKMDVAKEVVTQLVAELPAGTNVGLMAYGHREKDDCNDVELLVPIGPVAGPAFAEKVNGLQPVGQTPISFSIKHAAEAFKGLAGKKTIILISDGQETCKEDPCTVAASLKKADVDLRVHVVGFGIDTAVAKKQLNCIAESTGGVYRDAGNAVELREALGGLAQEPEAKADNNLVIDSLDSRGNRIYWCIQVYPAGRSAVPEREFEKCNENKSVENSFALSPGPHDIYFYGTSVASIPGKRSVEIEAGRRSHIAIETTGRAFLNVVDQQGSAMDCIAQVYSQSEDIKRGGTFHCGQPVELLPGNYDIEIWGAPVAVPRQKAVVIRSGEETRIDVTIDR